VKGGPVRRRKKTNEGGKIDAGDVEVVDPSVHPERAIPFDPNAPRELTERPPEGFEVREGDRLTVMYHGAKLSIAPYSSVDLDGAIYSRTLQPGDDAAAEFDRIHTYLRDRCLRESRAKLNTFADELRRAKERAGSK